MSAVQVRPCPIKNADFGETLGSGRSIIRPSELSNPFPKVLGTHPVVILEGCLDVGVPGQLLHGGQWYTGTDQPGDVSPSQITRRSCPRHRRLSGGLPRRLLHDHADGVTDGLRQLRPGVSHSLEIKRNQIASATQRATAGGDRPFGARFWLFGRVSGCSTGRTSSTKNYGSEANNVDFASLDEGCCTRCYTDSWHAPFDDPDLRAVVSRWPVLPDPIRAAILAMIEVVTGGESASQ